MLVTEITTRSPFKDLFPIRENLLNEIVKDMKANGYDKSRPIALWRRCGLTVVDGHTRFRAAELLKLKDVPTVMKDFSNEKSALEYTIRCQRNRRNLNEQELLQCISELDKRKPKGQRNDLVPHGTKLGKSSNETASILGVSHRKVERARAVLDKAPDEIKDAVKSGKMSINKAYNKTMKSTKNTPEILDKSQKEKSNVREVLDIIKTRLSKEEIKELLQLLNKEDVQDGKEISE